ncbi:M23 family metallopeptidase [Runella limosa]|uniref:M23 family metallopeptidase n=1 Tax=Runella limosa TaxID=370978 RepID=UPI0003FE9BD5|nr:M23 family metallopeptidase [Runella limosa]
MQKFNALIILILGLLAARSDAPREQMITLGMAFQDLNSQIREQTLTPDSAQLRFQAILRELRQVTQPYRQQNCTDSVRFVFPLRDYDSNNIGGHGSGFRPKGFNLFDHKVQGSHPAHDIFVYDRNQDSVDDQTDKPVDVLAMRPGIVVATETNWSPESLYRGGNFVWIYDPCLDGLFYYAHHSKVMVEAGDEITLGQKIAEVGRTGLNAAKARSGTHLHMMYLQLTPEALPHPVNTYDWLASAEIIR